MSLMYCSLSHFVDFIQQNIDASFELPEVNMKDRRFADFSFQYQSEYSKKCFDKIENIIEKNVWEYEELKNSFWKLVVIKINFVADFSVLTNDCKIEVFFELLFDTLKNKIQIIGGHEFFNAKEFIK